MKNKVILKIKNLIVLGLGLTAAIGLKYYYRQAGADDLLWILRPTATLVQWITGIDFVYESGAGFVSVDHRIIIAPACAGINFLIIAFSLATFSFMDRFRSFSQKIEWLMMSGIIAYLVTILVNTLRIVLSIYTYGVQIQYGWFTPERIHRLEGVVVYFLSLILFKTFLMRVIGRLEDKKKNTKAGSSLEGFTGSIFSSPLFWYCAVALGVPLINVFRQEQSPMLGEHCGMVIGICILIMVIKRWMEKFVNIFNTPSARGGASINSISLCGRGSG